MKQRKTEISFLNVLFCILVLYIHCTSEGVTLLPRENISHTILYAAWSLSTFVVQGFIFLSALKHFLKEDTVSYPKFLLSKLKTIFLPYTIWCVVYYLSFVAVGVYTFDLTELIKGIFIGNISAPFYYIIALMQFFLLFPLWKKIFRKDNIIIVLPVTIVISTLFTEGLPVVLNIFFPNHPFLYNDRIFTTYLAYWALGCYAGLYYQDFKAILLKYKGFICTVFILSAVGNVCLPYIAEKYGYSMFFLSDMKILYSIASILFTYMIALVVKDGKLANSKLLNAIDRSSYTIYLCHFLVLFAVDSVIRMSSLEGMHLKATLIRLITVIPISITYSILQKAISDKIKRIKSK